MPFYPGLTNSDSLVLIPLFDHHIFLTDPIKSISDYPALLGSGFKPLGLFR